MKYLSVCSGIEAASVAWHPLGWQPVAFSEIEPFPAAILKETYPDVPNLGDMTQFKNWNHDYAIDLLVGGTPCQSFSVAGLRKGLADPRGNLALTFLAIVDRYRPRWVVWENVPGVHSSWSDAADGIETEAARGVGEDARRALRELGLDASADAGLGDFEEVEQTNDFDCFLAGLEELGYGVATRILDAQYVRVESHPRAVPQRRRRVFVVGYLGDWRRAAAVLFERESLCGHPAPGRSAGQGTAGTLSARAEGGGGLGTDFDLGGGIGRRTNDEVQRENVICGEIVPQAMSSKWSKGSSGPAGDECANLVAHSSPAGVDVVHSLRSEGFDASEDGTGRGTPLVPIAFSCKDHGADADDISPTLRSMGHDGSHANGGGQVAIAFDTTQITSAANYSQPQPGDPCHPLAAGAHPPAIAIQAGALRENPASGPDGVGVQEGLAYTVEARAEVQAVVAYNVQSANSCAMSGAGPAKAANEAGVARCLDSQGFTENQGGTIVAGPTFAVRRLTPRECERLQGFPDDYTLIPWGGKDAAQCPDGPRYKALGNSMATNVMRWLGDRIESVDTKKPAPLPERAP